QDRGGARPGAQPHRGDRRRGERPEDDVAGRALSRLPRQARRARPRRLRPQLVAARRGPEPLRALTGRYFAATTMIWTKAFGSASFASTQARAGKFFGSAQAVHASFIAARCRMSVTQMDAESTFDLLDPALARRRSISARISSVCPFA